nr:DUF3108 domain-containing protein [Aromatoleum diolicum]
MVGKEPPVQEVLHARLVMPVAQPVELAALAPTSMPPPPAAAPKPKPPAKPVPKPKPVTEEPVPVPLAAPAVDEAGDAPASPVGEESSIPMTAADVPADMVQAAAAAQVSEAAQLARGPDLPGISIAGWPERGDIRFRVSLGEGGFQVGEARHEWSHDGKRYRMSVALRTTGVAGLFRSFHYAQSSEGSVGAGGLRPERFSVEQTRKTPANATFDWNSGQVTLKRGNRERVAAIRPGDQDLLSLWHQIGIVGAAGVSTELNVISGREATPSTLEVVGPEKLALPIGQLETLRVRAEALNGSLSIDIWLARNYGMLPVRIRVIDDKGEMLDQQAIELRLSPPGAPSGEASDTERAADAEMIELRADEDSAAHLTIGN